MSLIRPELAARLHRNREALAALAVLGAGVWVMLQGGWLLGGIGIVAAGAGAGLLIVALRRSRFARGGAGPGIVEVTEGQVAWYGPGIGGFVSLADLDELGLITVQGMRVWSLRQSDGVQLLIPVDARGAEALFDALTALPGIEGRRLLAALDRAWDTPAIWRRSPAVALRPP